MVYGVYCCFAVSLTGDKMVRGTEWSAEAHQREGRRQNLSGWRFVSSSLDINIFFSMNSLYNVKFDLSVCGCV